jgi:hypothetical protein
MDLAAPPGNRLRECSSDFREIHDCGLRYVEGSQSARMRLDLSEALGAHRDDSVDGVGLPSPLKFRECRQLVILSGDDELAANPQRNPVRAAEFAQQGASLDTEARLQRPGRIVDAGVDDTAVMARLVSGHAVLLLDDGDLAVGMNPAHSLRGGKADDSSADDRDVGLFRHGR